MSATMISGKEISAKLRLSVKAQADALRAKGVVPGLAVILAGDDPASAIYVRNKEKACEECGFYSEKYVLPAETSQDELLSLIAKLNADPRIHGILCQLPLPAHISEQAVILAIDPAKDVDAFHPVNVGRIMTGDYDFVPCTPAGVMAMLDECGIDPKGKHCVVVGRSNIVGKPMSML
ncbi:MAG: bifunctional 5,10-methylene-tetrahydrofolate dehydrogenase/5,10-methylene-tetrahydrofolate cyclohydrolase, partial [Clostridiaceae bacterium]|nr:bifunctional 5,10-methylene-tetrahydrofolate dehydrogenase/5,10-methylene-tetrahydrofolate cyclohydrolase [Clostridiaceae bacterium]